MRTGFGMLALVFLPVFASGSDAFVIVSDVDDTVKITDVLHHHRAVRNAIKSELTFAGMAELYAQMLGAGSSSERLRFISGSPRVLAHEIHEMLADSRFPRYNLTLRGFRETKTSALSYKTKHITALYGDSDDLLILIGDDTESDPEVYAAFAAAHPGRVLATYIRSIKGRRLPDSHIAFVTAYDIAAAERLAGRMNDEQVVAVASAVLQAGAKTFLPSFQRCPDAFDNIANLEIQARLRALCAQRNPSP